MDSIGSIVEQLDEQIESLQAARTLLLGNDIHTPQHTRRGRKPKEKVDKPVHMKRAMSDEARKRIGDAVRKRWANSKKALKVAEVAKTVKKTPVKKAKVAAKKSSTESATV